MNPSLTDNEPQKVKRTLRGKRKKKSQKVGYLLVLPHVVYLLTFIAWPVIFSVYLTFHEWNIVSSDKPFVGLEHYQTLFEDETFGQSLINTLYFIVVNIPIQIAMALLLAVALNKKIKFRGFFRSAYFVPVITSGVVVSFLWSWLLSTDGGLINSLLNDIGISSIPWLTSEEWAMPSLAWVAAWKNVGYYIIIFLAGLQGIPNHLYEAAKIDGANKVKQFFHITIPMLSPAMLLVVVLSTINGFQLFTEPFIMTGGGPANSSLSMVMYIYKNAFQSLSMGYAATLGVALALIILFVTFIQKKFLEKDTYY